MMVLFYANVLMSLMSTKWLFMRIAKSFIMDIENDHKVFRLYTPLTTVHFSVVNRHTLRAKVQAHVRAKVRWVANI